MIKHTPLLLLAICICIPVVSAGSDYCDPFPNNITTSIVHEGNWYNITFTTPSCYVCTETGGFMGDVDCIPCATGTFTGNVTCGVGTFGVQFNESTGLDPLSTTYYWDFGDGNTSTDQNPNTTYSTPGVYDVNFMTNNIYSGINWINKTGYMKARAIGDTCEATAKRYTSQMTSDSSMVYVIAFGGFGLLIIVFAMVIRRK